MAKPTKPRTASELMAELAGDELHKARARKAEDARQFLSKALARDAAPLLGELRDFGYDLESVWDLVNSANEHDEVIAILVRHLDRPYHSRNLEGIVRALTMPKARGIAGARLLALFQDSKLDADLRWVVGNALAEVATEKELDGVIRLLDEPGYGASRSMLVLAVARLLGKEAIALLMPRLQEEGMPFVVIRALGDLRAREAQQAIEQFLKSEDSELRLEAQKALREIAQVC